MCDICHIQTLEGAMSTATTLSTPQEDVDALIHQVAAENDLEITDQLKDLAPGESSLRSEASASKEDQLSRR